MTLEAAGPVLAEGLRSGAKGGRPGLRRLWAAALATWCPLTWFSWALAGSIRQYSGACLQPIPPRGPTELQPKERLGSQEAAWQPCWSARVGWPSLGSSPLPQGPTLLSWPSGGPLVLDSHQPWAFGGFNPCVWWRFPPFLSYFQGLYLYPCQSPHQPPTPTPQPTQHLPEIEP